VVIAFIAVDHGNGRHLEALSQEQQEKVVFWTLVGFPFGILSFGLPKLAVVALLTRIMNPSRLHKAVLWSMTIVCNVLLVLNALFLLGRCQPAESQWNFDIEGTCWNPEILVVYAITTGGKLGCPADQTCGVLTWCLQPIPPSSTSTWRSIPP
jgi:rhodopsin domain-containing protein